MQQVVAVQVLSIDAFVEGAGVGSGLLGAAADQGRRSGCRRLRPITTNDNLRALRFYQRRGPRLVAVYPGAVEVARTLKPSIPLVGQPGIEIRDKLEQRMLLE